MSGDGFTVKGSTAPFFKDGQADAMLAMILTLGAELSAMTEKVDTLVEYLKGQGTVGIAALESFEPDASQQAARDAERARLVQTILAPFQQTADALAEEAKRS